MKTVKHYEPIPCPENDRTAITVHSELAVRLAMLADRAEKPSTAPADRKSVMAMREQAVALLGVLFITGHTNYGQYTLSLCHIDSLYEQAVGVVRAPARKRKPKREPTVEYAVLHIDEFGDSTHTEFFERLPEARTYATETLRTVAGDASEVVGIVIERVRTHDPLDRTTIETHGKVSAEWIDHAHP